VSASEPHASDRSPERGAAEAPRDSAAGLVPFRRRLDELDEEIARRLGERFAVCREIALYKREHAIPMMQPDRVEQVRSRYLARGAEVQLPADFTADLFELLIAATCRMEDELIARDGAPEPERALARDAGSTRERLGDSAQAMRTGREP
jgi:4-amino-4-deoxychorismate mutase